MADTIVTTASYPNFSGLLFNKGNVETPFSTLIAGKAYQTNHVKFAVGQFYTTAVGTQPEISEQASLTAPDATAVKRSQEYNVTQIFQKSFGVSYLKQSDMGTLSGINVANQVANPIDEVAFQAAAAMSNIQQDIEYTFINGKFAESTGATVANKSKGILNAITSNALDANKKELGYWLLLEAQKSVSEANGDSYNLVSLLSGTQLMQVQKDAIENGFTVRQAGDTINGINITTILTPYGNLKVALGKYLPDGTALLVNPNVCAPVFQPVPGKGNFFLEELPQAGAGNKYQIYGQAGLDYGPEWYHAKITNLATTFTAPEAGILTRTANATSAVNKG